MGTEWMKQKKATRWVMIEFDTIYGVRGKEGGERERAAE